MLFRSPSHIGSGTATLCKKLGVPIVFVEIRNNYFISPKWRKRTFCGKCEVEVKRVMRPDEIAETDADTLASIIKENLSYNEFKGEPCRFRQKNKAKGLENVLYMCPHCRSLYSNISIGNAIKCTACGKEYHIKDDYRFEESDIGDLGEYYSKIIEAEKENIDGIDLNIPVDVKIFKDGTKGNKTEKGAFHLDKDRLYFKSDITDLYFEYGTASLDGIAYSVNEEFEMYYNDELYYFYPSKDDRKICTRVALLFEILKGEK